MKKCIEIRQMIRDGQESTVNDHLKDCPSCAEFADAFDILNDTTEPDTTRGVDFDRTFRAVEAQLESQSYPRRFLAEQGSGFRLAVVGACGLVVLILVLWLSRRVDWGVYPIWRWLLEMGGFSLFTGAFVVGSLRGLSLPPVPFWRQAVFFGTVWVMLSVPLLLPEAHLDHPESLKGVGDDFIQRALACFVWGIIISFALGIPSYFVSRGGRGIYSLSIGYWLAMALYAQAALHMHCPIVHPLHTAFGHTAIVPALLMLFFSMRLLK